MSSKRLKRAINFGYKLEQEYLRLIAARTRAWEVDYFEDLVAAFESLSKSFKIKIVHGTSHQVSFNGGGGAWARSTARCEIADLMIVAHKKGPRPSLRLSFIQVKLERGHSQLVGTNSSFNLKANLEQWDLLARRPSITGVYSTFQPSADLLSGAILPSIGCFLFLSPHGPSLMSNMILTRADALSIVGSPASKHGLLNSIAPGIRRYKGHTEIERVDTCKYFGASMFLHLVGTPIEYSQNAPDNSYRTKMRSLLSSILRDHKDQEARDLFSNWLIEDLDDYEKHSTFAKSSLPTVIFINTDDIPDE